MSYGAGAGAMSQRMVTAFFDSRTDAEEAVARLESAGIARGSVRLVPSDERDTSRGTASGGQATEGFWESLRDLFLPDEDRHVYAEGLSRGGYLVTVNVTDAEYDRALDILDDEGTIDIDERAASWRSEGWTGAATGTTGFGAAGTSGSVPATGVGQTSGAAKGTTGFGATGTSGSVPSTGLNQETGSARTSSESSLSGSARASGEGSEVIPVAEEELHVSKRDVNHGRVRIRSYVVERPVEEQVSLREERVQVERRPVEGSGRTGATSGEGLFQERTIEMDEKREEAVVSKEARVKEELVVRKDVEQRTETISDTVRSTEVDIEDERGNRVSGSGTGTGKTDRR